MNQQSLREFVLVSESEHKDALTSADAAGASRDTEKDAKEDCRQWKQKQKRAVSPTILEATRRLYGP